MRNKRFPKYPDDTDYNTNSPSYYDDLARKQKLIQLLAEKIWEYEETLDLTLEEITTRLESYIEENDNLMNERLEQWDLNLEKFPENVELLLQEWLSDGTLDHIINETIFNWKADKTYVDSEIERLDQKDESLTAQLAQNAINVKDFGAVGDGVTDDYEALLAVANYCNNVKSAKVIFEPDKTYYIGTMRNMDDDISNILFENMNYLELDFRGSTISFKGDVLLTNDYEAVGNNYTSISSIPFDIRFVKTVIIKNGHLTGNNDLTTKETPDTWTQSNACAFSIASCDNVTLENLHVEKFISDGFWLRGLEIDGLSIANKNITMINVTSEKNGRNNVSFTGNENVHCINCNFNYAGKTFTATYPLAGIDIEQEFLTKDVDISNMKYRFENCSFIDNEGTQPVVYGTGDIKNSVTFNNCLFDGTDGGQYISGDANVKFEKSEFRNITIYPFYGSARDEAFINEASVSIEECEFDSNKPNSIIMFTRNHLSLRLTIKKSKFKRTSPVPVLANFKMLWIQLKKNNSIIEDNTFYIEKTEHNGESLDTFVRLEGITAKNNTWDTNLTDVGKNFKFQLDGAIMFDEKILSKNIINGASYTEEIMSVNQESAFTSLILGDGVGKSGSYNKIKSSNSLPVDGTYRRGDIVFNTVAVTDGYIGWVCTQPGTPGTWRRFGKIYPEDN